LCWFDCYEVNQSTNPIFGKYDIDLLTIGVEHIDGRTSTTFLYDMETYFSSNGSKNVLNCIMHFGGFIIMFAKQEMDTHWFIGWCTYMRECL
jgi:hypothetical protein